MRLVVIMNSINHFLRHPCTLRLSWVKRSILILIFVVFLFNPFFITPVEAAAPVIVTGPLPSGTVGLSYSTSLIATKPCTWALSGGTLPTGLNLSANGGISGIPTTANTYSFFVTATDNLSASAMALFSITVNLPPITFSTGSLPTATEGQLYSAGFSVNNATSPLTWTLAGGSLPSGITLNPINGTLEGTPIPGTAGTYSFTLSVTDNSVPSRTAQRTFGLSVEKGYFRPTITIDPSLGLNSTKVFINGRLHTTMVGGETIQISVDLGTSPMISVDPVVASTADVNERYKADNERMAVNERSPSAYFT